MRWEYLVKQWNYFDPEATTFKIQVLGNDGWELVTIHKGLAYFKRPVDEQKPVIINNSGEVLLDEFVSRIEKRLTVIAARL